MHDLHDLHDLHHKHQSRGTVPSDKQYSIQYALTMVASCTIKEEHETVELAGKDDIDVNVDSNVNMNMNSHLSESNQSTKSSQGRKLRQVLQKKQLDVLLQTYSSFIDEAEEIHPPPVAAPDSALSAAAVTVTAAASGGANELSLIARKSSIEGNHNAFPMAEITEQKRNDASAGEEEAPLGDIKSRLCSSISLIEDDESCTGPDDRRRQKSIGIDNYGGEETLKPKRGRGVSNLVKEAKSSKDTTRKSKKMSSVNKRKKKVDFFTRMMKANEALKSFSGRAVGKQLEVAADFHEATKEIGYQLKSGANVMFEELADNFDGIVENFFVGETEARDDSGVIERGADTSSSTPTKPSQSVARFKNRNGAFERDEPNFHYRSHDETIQMMNKQVHDMFEPVVLLADKAEVRCVGVAEDLSFQKGKFRPTGMAVSL